MHQHIKFMSTSKAMLRRKGRSSTNYLKLHQKKKKKERKSNPKEIAKIKAKINETKK